jgi:hypothetical protein
VFESGCSLHYFLALRTVQNINIIINEIPINIDPLTIRKTRNPNSQVEERDDPPKQDIPNENISKQNAERLGTDGFFASVLSSAFFCARAFWNAVTSLSIDAIAPSSAASDTISPMTVFIINRSWIGLLVSNAKLRDRRQKRRPERKERVRISDQLRAESRGGGSSPASGSVFQPRSQTSSSSSSVRCARQPDSVNSAGTVMRPRFGALRASQCQKRVIRSLS